MTALYTAEATAWGGREGRVASSDGRVDLTLSLPKGLGGDDGPGTNPEQLFATGYAACFHSALKAVARREKVDVSASAVTVRIEIGPDDDGFALAAAIEVEIEKVDRDVAARLVEQAHALCPYSRATRGNIVSTAALVAG